MTFRRLLAVLSSVACLALAPRPAPAGIGLTVETSSLDALATDLGLIGRSMALPGLPAQATNRLSRLLGPDGLACVDMSQPLRTHVISPPLPADSAAGGRNDGLLVVHSLPLRPGGRDFAQALQARFQEHSVTSGLHRFSMPRGAVRGGASRLFVAEAGGRALVGTDADAVRTASREDGPLSAGGKAPGTVTLRANVAEWLPHLEKAAAHTAGVAGGAPGLADSGAQPARAHTVARELQGVVAVLKQIRRLDVSLSAGEDALDIRTFTVPSDGTRLASSLASLREPAARFLSALPPDALAAVAGTGLDHESLPAFPLRPDTSSAPAPDSWRGVLSGDYAFGVVRAASDQGLGLVYACGILDRGRADSLISGLLPQDAKPKLCGPSTVTALPGRRHGAVDVKSFLCVTGGSDTNATVVVHPSLRRIRIETALTRDTAVLTVGAPSVMDETLDRLGGSGPGIRQSPVFATLLADAPRTAVKLFEVQPVRLLKAVLGGMPGMTQDMLTLLPEDSGGAAGCAVTADGGVRGVARIAYSEAAALQGSALLLGGVFAAGIAAPGAGREPAAPESGKSRCAIRLRRIAIAKEHAALDLGLKDGAEVPPDALLRYLPGGKLPVCPSGGSYAVNPAGVNPECSAPGHSLR